MAGIMTPFTEVVCPVCGIRIGCRADKSVLVGHIRKEHPSASAKNLIKILLQELKLSIPYNIGEVSNEELYEFLANMCQYKATKEGLDEWRREKRGK
jgi:hypothetical protein